MDSRVANDLHDLIVIRGLAADGIRVLRVTGEQVSLAATATEVLYFFLAASARLFHPIETTEAIERAAVVPDLTQ